MTRWKIVSVVAACLVIVFAALLVVRAESFSYISQEKLKSQLTNPQITIIDVRTPHDWDSSQLKIKGARRESPADVSQWMKEFPKDKTLVLYCA